MTFLFHTPPPPGSPIHPKPLAPKVPEHLRLDSPESFIVDKYCCASDVEINEDGRSISIGCGTILSIKGWSDGKHYWEQTAKLCGWFSFLGVSTKQPCDEEEIRRGYVLSGNDGGFSFCGIGTEAISAGCPQNQPAFHAGVETPKLYPCFKNGDRVGLLLDMEDKGSLTLFINGNPVGEAFLGLLRCYEFFPAWSGGGQETIFADITLDLPIPQSIIVQEAP